MDMAAKSLSEIGVEDIETHGISYSEAQDIVREIQQILETPWTSTRFPKECHLWSRVSKDILQPTHPPTLHSFLFQSTYSDWNENSEGPRPYWIPTSQEAQSTNVAKFMKTFKGDSRWEAEKTGDPVSDWGELQRVSYHAPDLFWPQFLDTVGITFSKAPECVVDRKANEGAGQWLPGAQLSLPELALWGSGTNDGTQDALLFSSEGEGGFLTRWSLNHLRARASQVAWALTGLPGWHVGAPVVVCMPMTAESVAVYFGIGLAGGVVVSVADSFSAKEIGVRVGLANSALTDGATKPLCFTADVVMRGGKGLGMYSRVVQSGATGRVVCMPAAAGTGGALAVRLASGDIAYDTFMSGAVAAATAAQGDPKRFPAVHRDVSDTINVLFSSGTTGTPKLIPWSSLPPLRCVLDNWGHLDLRPGDVLCWPTSLGWMMGPWLLYGGLLNRARVAIFQGQPGSPEFSTFVCSARVTHLGLVPSLAAAWQRHSHHLPLPTSLRALASSGEASNPDLYFWLSSQARYRPVIELCGGTEIGGGFVSGSLVQAQAPSFFSTTSLASQIVLIDIEGGRQSPHDPTVPPRPFLGELAVQPPVLGTSVTLLGPSLNQQAQGAVKHTAVYFEGMPMSAHAPFTRLRRHGDAFERLPGGFYQAHGRVDDTMNLGGIKVSSVELERVCNSAHEALLETAAVSFPPPNGGPEQLAVFAVLNQKDPQVTGEALFPLLNQAIKENLNPLFKLDSVLVVDSLPRTATNKVMRRVLRSQIEKHVASRAELRARL